MLVPPGLNKENKAEILEALWDMTVPTGRYRYYDGLLQMLALLQVRGHFRIYFPKLTG